MSVLRDYAMIPRPSGCQQDGTVHVSGPLWNETPVVGFKQFCTIFPHISAAYLVFTRSAYYFFYKIPHKTDVPSLAAAGRAAWRTSPTRVESVVHKRSVAGVGRRYAVICRRVCVCVCDGQCGHAGPAAPSSCRASAHSLTRCCCCCSRCCVHWRRQLCGSGARARPPPSTSNSLFFSTTPWSLRVAQ